MINAVAFTGGVVLVLGFFLGMFPAAEIIEHWNELRDMPTNKDDRSLHQRQLLYDVKLELKGLWVLVPFVMLNMLVMAIYIVHVLSG